MEQKTIGSFMAALRKANGLTQRQLAEKLRVSDKAVSRWERDESAPDLTLIPVIAEIFGVTSDELLRGERSTDRDCPERAAAKTEKQIRHILKDTVTKYKIRSCISAAIALVGLLGAMICNFAFLRAYLGFLVGCIFLVVGALCQVIFLILGRNSIDTEEVDSKKAAPVRKTMILGAELVFGIIFLIFAACLPLVVLRGNPFWGLNGGSWLKFGALFVLMGGLAVLVPCTVFNLKRGYWHKPHWNSPQNRLRLRWLGKGTALLLAMALLHLISVSLVSQHFCLLLGGRKFDDWDDFRRYMETPTDSDGTPLSFQNLERDYNGTRYIYTDQKGNEVVFHKEEISRKIYATQEDEEAGEEPLVRYRHLNKQIASVRLNRGGLPVLAFTRTQMRIVDILVVLVHILWCWGYLAATRKNLRKYKDECEGI